MSCEGAGFVAEASGLPWAQFCPHPPVFGSKDAPLYGPGLRPGRGPITKSRDLLLRTVLHRVADRHLPPLNAMRAGLGLAPLHHLEDIFLSHGGQGITQKALAAGVPVCVVPFCRDQFEVARRVETADAGTRLHHSRLNPQRLRRAVQAAMTMTAGAARISHAFAQAGGANAAADAVEELLGANRHASTPLTARLDPSAGPQ